ncbi:hypothetical protein CHS0354_001097 [Potamilus streckersoni]|uniref:Major facilitator superfamily (MFS) profile domain-containing protein n=1 Tax=Potamilus streckersoni TaxID=2493646 RepID=A0AAE0VKX6_9BIVA|nr:hypothetical protein CHS0354_001097 [Potamilus streckersoni]
MDEAVEDESMNPCPEDRESLLHRYRDLVAVPYETALKQVGYGKFHVALLLLCGWAVSSDAIEILSVSFMLPSAECDLHLSSGDKGWLNAIVFIGMMVGGYFWGSMADRAGRRSILMWSLTVNGLGALASSTSQVFWLFLLMRFISGIGVGGSMPVIFSYFTEFQPKDGRGRMISALATFWMGGNIIAAGLAWIVIPQAELGYFSPNFTYNSWRIFIAICTVPSLTSAALYYLMPESPKFLLQQNREEMAIEVLRTIHNWNGEKSSFQITALKISEDEEDVQLNNSEARNKEICCYKFTSQAKLMLSQTKEVFSPSLRRKAVILLIVNFTLSFGYYGLWMWFPELFNRVQKYGGSPCDSIKENIPANQTNTTTSCNPIPDNWVFFEGFMTALSNLPGNVLTIFVMDKFGRKPLLVTSMVISGICVFFIPIVHNKVQNLLLSCAFGAVSTVGWNALDVLQTELFPTAIRSTAFGVMTGIARIAAILGNVVFGQLVDIHCSIPIIMVSILLAFGGLCSVKLPNTVQIDIH